MPSKRFLLPTLPHLLAAPGRPLIHRDLSGFQFNERVLSEARSSANPLLERVKFLAISASNLDEFFMIRYASLNRSIRGDTRTKPSHKRHLLRIRNSLLDMAAGLTAKQAETLDLLAAALAIQGVRIIRRASSEDPAYIAGKSLFEREILTKLSAPMPFQPGFLRSLKNLKSVAVFQGGLCFRIPRRLPAVLMHTEGKEVWLYLLDDLLLAHLGPAFRLSQKPGFFRLTRDGDIPMGLEEEDPASIPDVVRSELGSRDRGQPVRLQYGGDMPLDLVNQCRAVLRLSPRQVFPAPGSLFLHGLWAATAKLPEAFGNSRDLALPPLQPFMIEALANPIDIFEELKHRDILLHHPYESFDGYVNFIRAACADPLVEMIQQTVYRMDALSPVMEALKAAARQKKVRVLIELRARFDELNNLRLADDLRKAGVEVAFGFGRLKVHAKVALVTRRESGGTALYTHLSTGNYNAATARTYEDLAVITGNRELGEDAQTFFNSVCRGEVPSAFKALVPAPTRLHRLILQLIEVERDAALSGRPAYLFAKVNALVDDKIIESLYRASQAGVRIDLMVRGACSLVPGIKGLSERIRVFSLVDRFLEHSRIYFFREAGRMYLSSADWMPRNFFSRLELAFPVLDERLQRFIQEVVIPVYLSDTVKGRELTAQGTWRKRSAGDGRTLPESFGITVPRAQAVFEELARRGYRGTPLSRESARV